MLFGFPGPYLHTQDPGSVRKPHLSLCHWWLPSVVFFFFLVILFLSVSLNLCPFPQGTRILSVKGKNKQNTHIKNQAFHQTFESIISTHCVYFLIILNLLQMAFAPTLLPLFPPRLASSSQHPKAFAQSLLFFTLLWSSLGLPSWLSGKEPTCQSRRRRFNPWIGKMPWRRKWQPTPLSLPGKSHGQRSLAGYGPWSQKKSPAWLST